jgi:hypothetical protein
LLVPSCSSELVAIDDTHWWVEMVRKKLTGDEVKTKHERINNLNILIYNNQNTLSKKKN